jgi:hypothetical protein
MIYSFFGAGSSVAMMNTFRPTHDSGTLIRALVPPFTTVRTRESKPWTSNFTAFIRCILETQHVYRFGHISYMHTRGFKEVKRMIEVVGEERLGNGKTRVHIEGAPEIIAMIEADKERFTRMCVDNMQRYVAEMTGQMGRP